MSGRTPGDASILGDEIAVKLPHDVTFEEGSSLVEEFSQHFLAAELRRAHPSGGSGGTGAPDMYWALWVVIACGGVGVGAFAKKFFELLAEDAHAGLKKVIGGFIRRLRDRRSDAPPTCWYIEIDGTYPAAGQEPPRYVFRWEAASDEDLLAALRSAVSLMDQIADQPAEQAFRWSSRKQRWEPYKRVWR